MFERAYMFFYGRRIVGEVRGYKRTKLFIGFMGRLPRAKGRKFMRMSNNDVSQTVLGVNADGTLRKDE
jgi:hypothetical protein